MPKLRFLLLPFLSLAARASTSLTVSIADITPKPSPGSYVEADLQNCTNPTLLNTSQTVTNPQKFFFNTLNPQLTITLPDNISQISCNGNQLSYWAIYYVNATGSVRTLLKSVELPAGTFTLANLANLTTPPWNPGVIQGPPGQDAVPANLAGDVTGAITTTTINTIQGHPVTPVVLSGSYTDLTNKPTIPIVPTYTAGANVAITPGGLPNTYSISSTGGGSATIPGTNQAIVGQNSSAFATPVTIDATGAVANVKTLSSGVGTFTGPNNLYGGAIHVTPYASGDQARLDFDAANGTNKWQFTMAGDNSWLLYDNAGPAITLQAPSGTNTFSIFPGTAGTVNINGANVATPVNLNGQLIRTYNNPNGGYVRSFEDKSTYTRDSDIWISRNMGILNGHHEEASALGGDGVDFQFKDINVIARCGFTFPTQEGCHTDQRRTSGEAQMVIGSLLGPYGNHGVEVQVSQGINNFGAGLPVIDTSTKQVFPVTGTCTGNTCTVTGTVPVSKNGTLSAVVNVPTGTTYKTGASVTFGVTWAGATPATTDLCSISGASKMEPPFFPTAISSTSVTGILRDNHAQGDTIACGGLVGDFAENAANSTSTYINVEQITSSAANSISLASTITGGSTSSVLAISNPTSLNVYTGAYVADPGDLFQGGLYTGGGFVSTDTKLAWTPGHTIFQPNMLEEVFEQDLDADTILNPYASTFAGQHSIRHRQNLGGAGWTNGAFWELNADTSVHSMVPFATQSAGFTGLYFNAGLDPFPGWIGSAAGTRAAIVVDHLGATPICAVEVFGIHGIDCLGYDPNYKSWNVPNLLTTGGPITVTTNGQAGTGQFSQEFTAALSAAPTNLGPKFDNNAGVFYGQFGYAQGRALGNFGDGGYYPAHPLTNTAMGNLVADAFYMQLEGHHMYTIGNDSDSVPTLDVSPGSVMVNGSPVCTTTSGGCGSGGASFTPSAIQFATTSSTTRAATASDLYSLFGMDTVNSTVIPFNYGSGGAPTAPTSGQQLEASSSGIAVLHDATGTIQPVIAGTVTTVTLAPVGGQPYSLATASIVSLSHSPVCFASAVTPDPTMLPAGMPSVGTPVTTGTLTWSVPIYVYGSATNAVNVLCN